jgi:hypothetical protein
MSDNEKHCVAMVQCRMCGDKHMAVYPEGADDECLQCPRCEHMACEVVEILVQMHLAWSWTCPRCGRLNVSHGETVALNPDEAEALGDTAGMHIPEEVVCAGCLDSWATAEGMDDGPR